jgi:quercetin dioxygenase-like cupin family protein
VATLQRLAVALGVRMSYFFDSTDETTIVYAKKGTRPNITSDGVVIESIGARLREQVLEPFYLTLAPDATCGEDEVVHLGQEFVCCLRGRIEYDVERTKYILDEGDFLLFRADLPHCWRNPTDEDAVLLIVLEAPESPAGLARQHFARYPSVAYLG